MKTLSYKDIIKSLGEGNALRYGSISAKVHIVSPDRDILGAVRFDTYLKLRREKTIARTHATYSNEYYALA
jgi:hypothetical protein